MYNDSIRSDSKGTADSSVFGHSTTHACAPPKRAAQPGRPVRLVMNFFSGRKRGKKETKKRAASVASRRERNFGSSGLARDELNDDSAMRVFFCFFFCPVLDPISLPTAVFRVSSLHVEFAVSLPQKQTPIAQKPIRLKLAVLCYAFEG